MIKTYKNYVNNKFVRSESGFTHTTHLGGESKNLPNSSRKDLRDAIVSAENSFASWMESDPYLKSQIIFRVYEYLDSREEEFRKISSYLPEGDQVYDKLKELLLTYAGLADKTPSLFSHINPVAKGYLSTSFPEPLGNTVLYIDNTFLIDGISTLLAIIATGNVVTVLADPLSSIFLLTFSEILAVSDLPSGVVNILSLPDYSLLKTAAGHRQVRAIEISKIPQNEKELLYPLTVENLKHVIQSNELPPLEKMRLFTQIKTIWQTIGY